MTILSAMQSAAMRLLGQRPLTFFGASGNFEAEIRDLINEVAADVAAYQDWQALIRLGTVTGDGTQADFSLPDDYDRMLKSTDVADISNWFWGFGSYTDINSFIYDQGRGFSGFPGGWIIYGNKLRFSPAPNAGQTATFPYITNKWAIAESTVPKTAFDADSDSFALPDRLLTLGLVWRWRENKKLDATGDQEAFIKALDEYAAKDKGARSYRRSSRGGFPGTYPAWPYALGPSTYLDH